MRKYVLQTLFILCGFLVFPGCSDDDNDVDLANVVSAAAAWPTSLYFSLEDTQAASVDLSVAFAAPVPENINFNVQVASNSGVKADKVSFSRDHFAISKGCRSFELTCTIEADAVAEGVKKLQIEFLPLNAKVDPIKLEVPVEKEVPNSIVHVSGLSYLVDLGANNWAQITLPDETAIGGLFQTATAIGSAPAVTRIHFDNYGEKVIGTTDGDLINITPLEEGTLIGATSTWTLNPSYSDANWMYMPVLYSEAYQAWLGKTAYVGMNIQGYNFWFKLTASDDAVFTMTEYAYDKKGKDIKAGQTVSE